MTVKSRHRLRRMKRVYRRFAAVVSALLVILVSYGFWGHVREHDPTAKESFLGPVLLGLILGGVTYLGMLAVMATMQGRATLSGRGSGKDGKR